MTYIQNHLVDLSSLKRLAQFLSASGRLAEAEARYDDAAMTQLDVVRYGQASPHGGLIIDKLVGVAIDNIGLVGLARMYSHLNLESCRATLRALEELDKHSDSAAEYLQRDREWGRRVTGWRGRIQAMWLARSFFSDRLNEKKITFRLVSTVRLRRQVLLNFAARAYELEHGKRPLRAEELVPSVLRAIPKDPESGTNLVLNPAF